MLTLLNLLPFWQKMLAIGIAGLLVIMSIWGYGKIKHHDGYVEGKAVSEQVINKYVSNAITKQKAVDDKNVKTSIQVVTKYQDRVKVVKDTQYVYLKAAQTQVPTQFNLSKGWIYTYNSSVLDLKLDSKLTSDKSLSEFKDTDALQVAIQNNEICKENSEQLKALQTWIKQTDIDINEKAKNEK